MTLPKACISSESTDWLTPPMIVDAVISTLGEIDLDPCSPFHDGPVPAALHYTPKEDGLAHPWHGRVFMNPPYGDQWPVWVKKATDEYAYGHATEILILIGARTETRGFKMLNAFPWCAIGSRLHFSGSKNSAGFPSAMFYLGKRRRFYEVFSELGQIWTPYQKKRSNSK